MKILTATSETQGRRDSDFTWCVPGEIVAPPDMICDWDRQVGPDDGCGCGRSFNGLNSGKGTTTAIATEIDGYEFADLVTAVLATRRQEGWTRGRRGARRAGRDASNLATVIAETAAGYEAGTVLEVRMGKIGARER